MNEGTKDRVSELLSEASKLFPSSSSTALNPAVSASRLEAIPQTKINEILVLRECSGGSVQNVDPPI